jgi:hypothetical protein
MLVANDGAVWQARCDWGWDLHGIAHHCIPEGGYCHAWVYARVSPGPITISRTAPPASFDSGESTHHDPIPSISPSPAVHAEIVHVPLPERGTERAVLKCTAAGKTIQYPTDDDRDERDNEGDGVSDLTWLSTTPPMFAVTRRVGCLDYESVVFEGCQRSDAKTGATIAGGPQELVVLLSDGKLTLRRHDRDIGALDGVRLFAFAPGS